MHERLRVVIDTNVLISALVGQGKPRRLVLELLERHEVVTSAPLLAELMDVLSRERFSGIEDREARTLTSVITRNASVVTVKRSFKVVPEDPDDDIVLSTAHEGKVSYIVSGDSHLLNLGRFRGVRIVTVSEMLELL